MTLSSPNERKQHALRIDAELLDFIARQARRQGRSVNAQIGFVLDEWRQSLVLPPTDAGRSVDKGSEIKMKSK
jgi:hypothetical protein